MLAPALASAQTVQSISRSDRAQADTLGVRYVAGAGYNPGAAPLILAKLGASTDLESRAAGRGGTTVPTWLSTHPSSAARVAQARTLARQTGRGTDAPPQDIAFLKMLDGLRYGDDPAQGVVDGQTFRQPAMRIKFTAPTGYAITNGAQAVTVQGANGQAQLMAAAQDQSPMQAVAKRFEALGGQIPAEQIREISVGGRRAATATVAAAANNQRVDATVVAIAFPSATYVWTMITPSGDGGRVFDPMLASFTSMTAPEADAVRGKRILVYTVRAGDTIESVSRRMAYADLQTDRFLTLNGLTSSTPLRPGMLVKLVVTG